MNQQAPLEVWRTQVRPLLNSVGWYAYRCRQFADMIVTDIARIPTREPFETITEDELTKARASLAHAIEQIDASLKTYQTKKVA